jgi:hypothetical protein
MANAFFLRKLAQDELWDTLFFATGELPSKEKTKDFTILSAKSFTVKIFNDRRIIINDTKCNSVRSTKLYIQQTLS